MTHRRTVADQSRTEPDSPDLHPSAVCHWRLAGEAVQLLAGRALFWPARQRLLLADLHLGKEDTFRRSGLAVPEGVTRADLARLSEWLVCTGATALWVLGDMLHGQPEGQAWRAAWEAFRTRHASIEMRLIAGNHDRHAARADLGLIIDTADAVRDGPFVFTHEPPNEFQARASSQARVSLKHDSQDAVVVAGHWHPVVRVGAFGRDLPAFVFDGQQLVLPAFSDFTGGLRVRRPHRAAVCVQGHVLDLTPEPRTHP